MVMNISCKSEKASYNIFFIRAVMVKSLYTLRRRRRLNEVKSIVSTGCYPVDTMSTRVLFNSPNHKYGSISKEMKLPPQVQRD